MSQESTLEVLLCSDYLSPSDGGVEKVIDELLNHLSDEDVEFHVFSLTSTDQPTVNLADNVEVHLVNSLDLREYVGVQSKLSVSALDEIHSLLRDFDPDVLHLHNRFFYTSAVAYLVAKATRFKGKIITTIHLGDVSGISGVAGVATGLYEHVLSRMIVRGSDRIVAVSRAAAAHAISLGATKQTTHVVQNGVDTDVFHPASDPPERQSILYVGRLVKNKGPQDLLEALPKVFDEHPNARATFVGTGPLRDKLKTRVRELNIENRVKLSGRVEDVSAVMRKSSVFCRPSYTEGLPLTLLEAMATGIPPVVTPVAGVPEVVDDRKTGILVPQKDPDALSDALTTVLNEPETASELGRSAREYVVENHSWDNRADQIIEIYKS